MISVKTTFNPPLSNAVLHILLALSSGDLHGYGIMQEVRRISENRYRIGTGTLYANLGPLLEAGLVMAHGEGTEDSRRNYRLTTLGTDLLRDELQRLATVVRLGQRTLAKPKQAGA